MITALTATDNRYGRTPTPSTLHRIRATLRSALNAAIREFLLRDNPARYVEVPSPRRPHARVWTAPAGQGLEQTGERPSVAVWTTEQTATFLTFVAQDRLAVMWCLIALRGLRRGEAAGLRWADADLDAGVFMVEQQRIAKRPRRDRRATEDRRQPAPGRPRPAHGGLLREHRRRQPADQRTAGEWWQDSGYVFTTEDGLPLHPDYLTRRFRYLVGESGLPPVRWFRGQRFTPPSNRLAWPRKTG
jgi:integrase